MSPNQKSFMLKIKDDFYLRWPQIEDTEALFLIFSTQHSYLSQWLDWPLRLTTKEDCERYIQRFVTDMHQGKAIPLVLIYQEQLVGMCDLDIKSPVVRNAELSYWLAEKAQGKGLMTLACETLIHYGFVQAQLNRIYLRFKHHAPTGQENTRSRAMAERLGFTYEGIEREGGMTQGVFMDMVCYSMLAREWQAISGQLNMKKKG